jgi:hypothetical protein
MTKYLLSALLAPALCLNAQTSIQLKNKNGNGLIKPNTILVVATQALDNTKITIDVQNVSGSTKAYNAKRYDVLLNSTSTETASAYFCFAGTCYGWQVSESPTSLTLTSGQSASEVPGDYQMLVGDLD